MTALKIALIEGFYSGSHKQWADDFARHSAHEITLFTLPASHWKWRMHGGAISLAKEVESSRQDFDLFLVTDMIDLSLFKSLLSEPYRAKPFVLYFHENQITYPWSKQDRDRKAGRSHHYGFINYSSALVADHCFFNSHYHRNEFLKALPQFLSQYPDYHEFDSIDVIAKKSSTLHLALDLESLNVKKQIQRQGRAAILWNHRWDYDKDAEKFFSALFQLREHGIEFKVIVLGEGLENNPKIFAEAQENLADRIIHWGYAESRSRYAELLWQADILPVTSRQDFFGGSIIEAVACNTIPLLPKRLAYPEHFTLDWQRRQFFYDENELVSKLQRYILDVKVLRKQTTRDFVMHYDWKAMIDNYDKTLSNLL